MNHGWTFEVSVYWHILQI